MSTAKPILQNFRAARSRASGSAGARGWGFALSALVAASVAGLAVLHVWLLWRRIAEQEIFEPLIAVRWLAALALLGGFAWLRRQGVPLLYGRRALVLWLLVALLHLGVSVTGVESSVMSLDTAVAAERWLALPIVSIALALLAGALLALLHPVAPATASPPPRRRRENRAPAPASAGFEFQLSPRPPPRLSLA